MGMFSDIYGIKPADEKFKQMKAIYDACDAAHIDPPDEVYEFFNHNTPDPNGVIVPFRESGNRVSKYHEAVTPIQQGYPEAGFYVDITKLPPDVKIIKFENSW